MSFFFFFSDPALPEAQAWLSDEPLFDDSELYDMIMAETPLEGLSQARKTLEKEQSLEFPSFDIDPDLFTVQLEAFLAKEKDEKKKRKAEPEDIITQLRRIFISSDAPSTSTENIMAPVQSPKRAKLVIPASLPPSSGENSPMSDNDEFFSDCASIASSELFDFGDEDKPTLKPYLPSEIRRLIWSHVVTDLKRCNNSVTTFSNGALINTNTESPYISPISYLLVDRATNIEFTDALYENSAPLVLYVTAAGIYINEHDKKLQPSLWQLIFEHPRQIWLSVRSMEIRIQAAAWKEDSKADDRLQKNIAYLASFLNRTHFSKLEQLKIGIYLDTGCSFNADRARRLRFYLHHMESVQMQRNSHLKIPAVTIHGIEYLNQADPTIPRNATGTILPYDSADPTDIDESVLYLDFVASVMALKQKQSRRGVSRVRRANGTGKGFFVSPTLKELRHRERRAKADGYRQRLFRSTPFAQPWNYSPIDTVALEEAPVSKRRGDVEGLGPEDWDMLQVASAEENAEAAADVRMMLEMVMDES